VTGGATRIALLTCVDDSKSCASRLTEDARALCPVQWQSAVFF
jgi:hypothetical protein